MRVTLLLFLFSTLAWANFPPDLPPPTELTTEILKDFSNYLYRIEMQSVIRESASCKHMTHPKGEFNICISRSSDSNSLRETVHYFVNNQLSTSTIFFQRGAKLSPTPNKYLYNFKFPNHQNTEYSLLEIFRGLVIIEYSKDAISEKSRISSKVWGDFRTSISDYFHENQKLREYDMLCNRCFNARLTIRDQNDTITYYDASGSELNPLSFRTLFNQIYVYHEFANGLYDYATKELHWPE